MWRQEDWAWLFDKPESPFPWNMDARHVAILNRVAATGLFSNVLEIGCHLGASTSALVQSQIDGAKFYLTCCDINITDSLRSVVARSPRVRLEQQDSFQVIDQSFDLIVLDGDHTLLTVSRELGLLLYHQTPTIFLHDTNSHHVPTCDGPPVARAMLECHPDFQLLTDCKLRPGEFTDRGITLATRCREVYAAAKVIFDDA